MQIRDDRNVSLHGEPRIRTARASDAEDVLRIYAPLVESTAVSFETHVPSREEMVTRMNARPMLPWIVAHDDIGLVGYACASRHRQWEAYRWSVESSVYVAEKHRRHGIGQLLEKLTAEVTRLGYLSLFAGIALPNPASVQLHEAVGFEFVGTFKRVGFKLGAWRDVGWWSRQLRVNAPADPKEPREWDGSA